MSAVVDLDFFDGSYRSCVDVEGGQFSQASLVILPFSAGDILPVTPVLAVLASYFQWAILPSNFERSSSSRFDWRGRQK